MRKTFLRISVVTVAIFTLSGCCDNNQKTPNGSDVSKQGRIHINSRIGKEFCYEGLIVVKMGLSNYSNGYFYKRTIEDKLIQCTQ